jgi:hypothetical protein
MKTQSRTPQESRSPPDDQGDAPLPDDVWIRYYRDHPEEPLLPEHEHLHAAVRAARQPAAE